MERLPSELVTAGITGFTAANRYLKDVYLSAYNREFQQVAQQEGSAFEPCTNPDQLDDILCEEYQRIVRRDNRVRCKGLLLRLPIDRLRCRMASTRVTVRRHLDGSLSISSGIRRLARYHADGTLID